MSNPPELSSKRSSLAINTLRQIKRILTSPYGVAAIASLSFHGILFAAMPRFSSASFAAFSEDNAPAEPRTVPLVTLSPAEQERLPDFNRSQLPSIPDISSPPPSIDNLPNASTFNRSNIFNRSNSSITTPSFSRPSLLSRNRPFRNPYIPSPNLSIRDTPSRSEQSSDRRTAPITNIPKPPPSVVPDAETDQEPSIVDQELEPTTQEGTNEQVNPTAEEPSEPPAEDDGVETDSEDTQLTQLERLERLRAKFEYSTAKTDEDGVNDRYNDWIANTIDREDELTLETANIQALAPVDSGLRQCVDVEKEPSAGKVGLFIAPDGTASEADVLLSTGYEYLNQGVLDGLRSNQEALQELIGNDFPEAETPVPYVFEFEVEYDKENCNRLDALQTD